MKTVVINESWNTTLRTVLTTLYFVLPVAGWFIASWAGPPCGLIAAVVIDYCFPRWIVDLSWEDLRHAVANQARFGAPGSRLFLRLAEKNLCVYHDKKDGMDRSGIQVAIDEWSDIITEDLKQTLLSRWRGWLYVCSWRGKQYQVFFPEEPIDGSFNILKELVTRADGGLKRSTAARLNYTSKDIWAPQSRDA